MLKFPVFLCQNPGILLFNILRSTSAEHSRSYCSVHTELEVAFLVAFDGDFHRNSFVYRSSIGQVLAACASVVPAKTVYSVISSGPRSPSPPIERSSSCTMITNSIAPESEAMDGGPTAKRAGIGREINIVESSRFHVHVHWRDRRRSGMFFFDDERVHGIGVFAAR
jgi:hypothetical protein